jgi:hypothetical protein
MDRFSVEFNDVDPVTGRPFSAGHPDGVWMMSIIYLLGILSSGGVAIFGIYKITSGSTEGYAILLAALLNALILVIPIYFLFKRSQKAIYAIAFIAFFMVLSVALSLLSGGANKYGFLIGACVQVYFYIYVVGLKEDGLLT